MPATSRSVQTLLMPCTSISNLPATAILLPRMQAEPMIVVDASDLKEYVGQPPYPTDKIYAEGTPAGALDARWCREHWAPGGLAGAW